MRGLRYIAILLLMFLSVQTSVFAAVQAPAAPAAASVPVNASLLGIVNNPASFLGKNVVLTGKFDKFTTLGLDYKKAFRDSTKYIGFMFQRDDVRDHNVPLSGMKLFVLREYAEKFIDLNTGDKIKVTGSVFSDALGDAWVDVKTIEIIEKVPSDKEK